MTKYSVKNLGINREGLPCGASCLTRLILFNSDRQMEVRLSDFSTRENYNLSPSERVSISKQLDRVREKVMAVWESRVRESIASASAKSTPVLRSQLPELLENLVTSISLKSTHADIEETAKIGKDHGKQRARLRDYTFSQVLHEYRILRQVIFEVLEEEHLQVSDVRDIILNVLDEGIEKAIDQFSSIRTEELNRSNRDLEHFASIAAHDLKSPLATIAGYSELLEESLQGKLEIRQIQYLQGIQRSSARMTLLIDRLLEYSSVGRELKPFEFISANQILTNVVESLKTILETSKAQIHFSDLPVVFGDISLLSQVFQNFINNSVKFCDPEIAPEIHVDAKEDGDNWLFSIRDNGVGFDQKEKENIFSLFKRLDITKEQTGSGIGLATTRKVVELHGGRVWAESQLGEGSTFYFTLPKTGNSIRFH